MIKPYQIRAYASAGMPENNTDTPVGGAIDLTTAIDFADLGVNGQLQVVSSSSSDTTQSVTIHGRLQNGSIVNEAVTLTGQTPVPTVQNAWERFMKAIKSASTAGVVAVEAVTPDHAGTLQATPTNSDEIQLAPIASNQDGAYVGMVVRLTGGGGVGSIAKILSYFGTTRTAILDQTWVGATNASTYRVSRGIVFTKAPTEVLTVRRPFYNVVADISGGVDRMYYEKFFWVNNSLNSLASSVAQEAFNPTGRITFGLDPVQNGTLSTSDRLTLPIGVLFGRSDQSVGTLAPSSSIGIWLRLFLPAGQSPVKSSYGARLYGITS